VSATNGDNKMRVAVVGGGTWGVALSIAAKRAGAEATLYSRRSPPQVTSRLRVATSFSDIGESRLVVLAVPSTVAREVLRQLGDYLDGSHLLVHGIRGLSAEHFDTVSDIAREETAVRRLGALGGPVQASELLEGQPSAMVIGSHYPEVISAVTTAFQHKALRVYGTPDLRGLEWASAMVGCLSVGVGFADQAGAGPGLLAALISRGVDEAARIAAAAGADERTMLGLGGYGDLLASIALENRPEVVLGRALAKGASLDEAVAEAKLRVEAITLIPRIAQFAKDSQKKASAFDALDDLLRGVKAPAILEKMFAG
jgi:glycerol-3-phosphate dehydrogenase (NAD(P)+)